LVWLASDQIRSNQQCRSRLAKDLIDGVAEVIEVSRDDTECFATDATLDLPLLQTPSGKFRKISTNYKLAVVKAVRNDPDVGSVRSFMAGRRIWGKAGHKLPASSVHTWQWDTLFAYMANGWQTMPKTGPLILVSDGLWLSGEECSYYNFIAPSTGANVWSTVQAWQLLVLKKKKCAGVVKFAIFEFEITISNSKKKLASLKSRFSSLK
jgi:hypothetical protein